MKTVTLHDLEKHEPIVSVLLRTSDIADLRVTFDRTNRDEIESRLTAQAVADARAKAMLMAEAAGQRIVALRAISRHGFYNLPGVFGIGEREHQGGMLYSPGERSSGPGLLVIPSTIEFENTVSIIYEIAEKK